MHTTHRPTALTTVGTTPIPAADGPARQPASRPRSGERSRAHWSSRSLPTRLNAEWRQLCGDPDAAAAVAAWAEAQPALARVTALEQVPRRVSGADPASRDAILLALLTLAQSGDRLAGRAVLQVMMPKAVRVAMGVLRRPDVAGDRDEAFATAVAALWQVIARYPIERRPNRVPANLAMDTLAVVQRGHTGSSHFARTFPERPFADLREVCEPARRDVDIDDLSGPADAEVLMLLAWGVRTGVLALEQARFLARAYGLDGGPARSSAIVAADYGISATALRQRCHRLARHLGRAAVEAGITPAGDCPDPRSPTWPAAGRPGPASHGHDRPPVTDYPGRPSTRTRARLRARLDEPGRVRTRLHRPRRRWLRHDHHSRGVNRPCSSPGCVKGQ